MNADSPVLPVDQRIAAELAEACAHADADKVAALLSSLADAGPERALAVTTVLARNLAATLVAGHGRDEALAILERTRLDAALAE